MIKCGLDPVSCEPGELYRRYTKLGLTEKTLTLLDEYLEAFANFYGCIPVPEAYEVISKCEKGLLTKQQFYDFIEVKMFETHNFYLLYDGWELDKCRQDLKPEDICVCDCCFVEAGDVKGYYELAKMQEEVGHFKLMNKKELLKYRDPYYYPSVPEAKELYKYLKDNDLLYPTHGMESVLEDFISGAKLSFADLVNSIMFDLVRFLNLPHDFSQRADYIKKIVPLASKVYENVPMWDLCGFTPKELGLDPFNLKREEYNRIQGLGINAEKFKNLETKDLKAIENWINDWLRGLGD